MKYVNKKTKNKKKQKNNPPILNLYTCTSVSVNGF